jgi:DNA invertase Pin-like site-specific DNA recombinase
MTKEVPRHIKLDAVIMKAKGVNPEQITRSLPISRSTIYRAKQNLKEYGDVAEKKEKPGPDCSIPSGIGEVFIFLLFYLADII